ncbi:unnamed protein product [Meganyctiphanes norvegica]|uniref:Uncharacterized protein n=1 Tax=Meganyctiphanes norvegica TaxID=48144 RepID=A0AAV2RMV0_MEGNR
MPQLKGLRLKKNVLRINQIYQNQSLAQYLQDKWDQIKIIRDISLKVLHIRILIIYQRSHLLNHKRVVVWRERFCKVKKIKSLFVQPKRKYYRDHQAKRKTLPLFHKKIPK